MKKLFKGFIALFFVLSMTVNSYSQKALHSDFIDVLHYTISLEIFDFTNQFIKGSTELTIVPKVNNLQSVDLDVLVFFIDSIMVDGTKLMAWNYDDTLLTMPLPHPYNTSDTMKLTVYYYGHPQQDPGADAWGGFKWTSNTAYNLGVGFVAIPHNFGRCWYPCIDDFVDRATYDFYITVDAALGHMAVCGGTLISMETNTCSMKRVCHWNLSSEIPTYLASVAVGSYVAVTDTFNGQLGQIPIELYVRPSDSLKAVNSFINLKTILTLFENKFGPYRWERVGYVGVDFDAGAMEHATNIATPNFCITGNTGYEELFAHELSHHWFGDLITCRTAQDMWINEGWATFSEMVYEEAFFGRDIFVKNKRAKLNKVVRYNQIEEGGYVTLNQVPDSITYGSSSYDKGGLVTQTLRSYIGDSLFYASVKDMLDSLKFRDVTSEQMRDYLSFRTGTDMTGFFNNWVFSPGFPHFSVDSFKVVTNGPDYDVTVYSREKLRGRSTYSEDNRLEVTFMDNLWNMTSRTIEMSGGLGVTTVTIPFMPKCVMMDLYEKTDDATNDCYKIFKNNLTYTFDQTYFTGIVNSITDSAFIRTEHNLVAPDGFITPIPGILISKERYWKIDGICPSGFNMKGKFYYCKSGGSGGYLDMQLITNSVDSLVLLYRPNTSSDWTIIPSTRSGSSVIGYLNTDTVKLGEYTFGIRNWALYHSVGELYENSNNEIRIIPNPAKQTCNIKYNFRSGDELKVIDIQGKILFSTNTLKPDQDVTLAISDYNPGLYFIQVNRKNNKSITGRMVVE